MKNFKQPVQINLITGDGLELDQAIEMADSKIVHLSFGARTMPVAGHELACGASTPLKPLSWYAVGSFTEWVNNPKTQKGYSICLDCISKRSIVCHI